MLVIFYLCLLLIYLYFYFILHFYSFQENSSSRSFIKNITDIYFSNKKDNQKLKHGGKNLNN